MTFNINRAWPKPNGHSHPNQDFRKCENIRLCGVLFVAIHSGSMTTDCDKLITNQLTVNNADWLRRAILNIFLLSPEPSCPNPHFVTKSLQRNHVTKSLLRGQFVRGQLTWLVHSNDRKECKTSHNTVINGR